MFVVLGAWSESILIVICIEPRECIRDILNRLAVITKVRKREQLMATKAQLHIIFMEIINFALWKNLIRGGAAP